MNESMYVHTRTYIRIRCGVILSNRYILWYIDFISCLQVCVVKRHVLLMFPRSYRLPTASATSVSTSVYLVLRMYAAQSIRQPVRQFFVYIKCLLVLTDYY